MNILNGGRILNMDLEVIKTGFRLNLESLNKFEFNFFNPVFWLFMFILFLILRRNWMAKDAFTFCSMVSMILLLTTEFEGRIAAAVATGVGEPDVEIVRLVSLTVIAILFLAYTFLRKPL